MARTWLHIVSRPRSASAGVRDAQAQRRGQAGFTLVEVLAAIAILALLGTVVVSAMAIGSRVMGNAMNGSNSAVLEQSIDTALSDVLRFANVQAPAGASVISTPVFDSDSYTNYAGSPVRGGYVEVDAEGHLSLNAGGGSQSIPKAAGIYTDFVITDFQLDYDCDSNLFVGTYRIVLPDGSFERACEFYCRTLIEETYL